MVRTDKEAKKKRKIRIAMGLFVVIVMVGGGLGIFADNVAQSSRQFDYETYKFTLTEAGWQTKIDGKKRMFNYHPLDVENINVTGDIKRLFLDADIILVTNNPYSRNSAQIAYAEDRFASMLYMEYGKMVMNGFSEQTQYDVPLIDCANATSQTPVVLFEDSDNNKIELEGSCLYIYATDESGFHKSVERIYYVLLGVMD